MVEVEPKRYRNPLCAVVHEAAWFVDQEPITDKPDSLANINPTTISICTQSVVDQWGKLSAQQRQNPESFLGRFSSWILLTLIATDAPVLGEIGVRGDRLAVVLDSVAHKELDEIVKTLSLPDQQLDALREKANQRRSEAGIGGYFLTIEDFKGSVAAPLGSLRSLQQKLRGEKPLRHPAAARS